MKRERDIWSDLKGPLGALIGAALGILLFGGSWLGIVVGATIGLIVGVVYRHWKNRPNASSRT